MRIALGADHGGFVLKTSLVPWLESQDYEILDLGAEIFNSADDYPDYAEEVAPRGLVHIGRFCWFYLIRSFLLVFRRTSFDGVALSDRRRWKVRLASVSMQFHGFGNIVSNVSAAARAA